MRNKIIGFLLMILAVIGIAGCGKQKSQLNTQTPNVQPTEQTSSLTNVPPLEEQTPPVGNPAASEVENPASGNDLFLLSKADGTVVEFTAAGCTLAPTRVEEGDGFSVGEMPAPGHEDDWDHISVVYDNDCTFYYAYASVRTGEVQYEPATADNVKKQTSLIIWGGYDSDNVLHAQRVFLYRLGE